MASIMGWAGVLLSHDVRLFIFSAILAMISLGFASYRYLNVLRRRLGRIFPLVCLGVMWSMAIILIYHRLQVIGVSSFQ
jgi:hypothetical protein